MSRIKIYGHKYGDNALSASTRIRYYRVIEAMQDVDVVSMPGDADVVYIQKRVGPETLALAEESVAAGKVVVYDIDDAPGQCACAQLENKMLTTATRITTDTRAKVNLYSRDGFGAKVRLVPDCLDYWDSPPEFEVRPEIKNVLLFGHQHSIRASLPFALALRNAFPSLIFKIVTVGTLLEAERFEWIPWTIETTKAEMLKADVAMFCHPSDLAGTLRPATRLITAWAAGLPSIALSSGAHPEVMRAAGMESLLFCGEDIKSKLKALTTAAQRRSVIEKGRAYAWDNFAPAIVAAKLRSVFEEAIDG